MFVVTSVFEFKHKRCLVFIKAAAFACINSEHQNNRICFKLYFSADHIRTKNLFKSTADTFATRRELIVIMTEKLHVVYSAVRTRMPHFGDRVRTTTKEIFGHRYFFVPLSVQVHQYKQE